MSALIVHSYCCGSFLFLDLGAETVHCDLSVCIFPLISIRILILKGKHYFYILDRILMCCILPDLLYRLGYSSCDTVA